MPALIEAATRRSLLWLNARDYAQRLLANGNVDWLDVAAVAGWQRKTQGLLPSDVIELDVAPVLAQWLQADAQRRIAMAQRRRTPFALKTLLADPDLRGHFTALMNALRACFPAHSLALTMPGPAHWLRMTYAAAHGVEPPTIEDDDVEAAAMYLADFLRIFAESGIDTILIGGSEAVPATAVIQPVLNVCRHYRWEAGWHLHPTAGVITANPGFDYLIAAAPIDGVLTGVEVPAAFWHHDPPPTGRFRHAVIPPELQPEQVLERLAELRRPD
jgi:hypothetical protein